MYTLIIIFIFFVSSPTICGCAEDDGPITYVQIVLTGINETSPYRNVLRKGEVQSKYSYRTPIEGWIVQHKVIATWDDAYRKCRAEGYGILASPINQELLQEMKAMMGGENHSTSYFIGTNADFYPGRQFVSIEGIPLEDMPVSNMIKQLDTQIGSCLSMNRDTIDVVSCGVRLPYWCYRKQEANFQSGPCDNGYLQYVSTGSCYKMHYEKTTWDQAYTTCTTEGGYLVIIDDEREAQIVHNITGHLPDPYVFIGLRDRDGRGDWMSVHGHRVEQLYNVWSEGEKLSSVDFRCGRILNTGKLDYGSCSTARAFLCEKEAYSNVPFRPEEA